MKERQTMYRAHCYFGGLSVWHPESEAGVFCSTGELSDCGRWIEARAAIDKHRTEVQRFELSDDWQPTRAAAEARLAGKLRQIGERLIRQANDLEAAARAEEVVA